MNLQAYELALSFLLILSNDWSMNSLNVWNEGFVIDKLMREIDNQPIVYHEDTLELHGGIVNYYINYDKCH